MKRDMIQTYSSPLKPSRLLAAAAALLLAVCMASCTKEPGQRHVATGETVTVTLPPLATQQSDAEILPQARQIKAEQTAPEAGVLRVNRSETTPETRTAGTSETTRATHPALQNVWVLQFAADGTTLQCNNIGTVAENAAPQATLNITENCTVYILANGPSTGLNPANLAAFEAAGYDPTTAAADAVPLYSGKMENITVETDRGKARIVAPEGIPPMIWLRPLTATLKVNFSLNVPGWEVVSMELFNVPKTAGYAAPATEIYPAADDANFLYPASGDWGWTCTPTTTGDASSGWLSKSSWNVPDNRRGTIAGITKEKERNHANAPANATFVRVTIFSLTPTQDLAGVTFDIYPGGDELTDFNLIRNHTYTLDVMVEGTEDDLKSYAASDDRVTLIQPVDLSKNGTANCYIVPKAGTTYIFDATKKGKGVGTLKVNDPDVWADQRTKINPNDDLISPKALAPVSAFTVWSTGLDINGLIKKVKCVRGKVLFTTTGAEGGTLTQGNALIGIRDAGGNLIWSWHLWITDYNPADVTYVTRALAASGSGNGAFVATSQRSFVMMDRNLGATNNTPGDIGSFGLYYQWGRKDPFIGPKTVSSDNFADTRTAAGFGWVAKPSNDIASGADVSIAYAVKNPTHYLYIKNNKIAYDWLNVNTLAEQRDYLWGNPNPDNTIPNRLTGAKSIYDPCPPGYRVPQQDSWTRFTTTGKKSTTSSEWNITSTTWVNGEGWTFYYRADKSGQTSFHPASGCQLYHTGTLGMAGTRGFFWGASPGYAGIASATGFSLADYGLIDPWYASFRSSGNSVRCAKE